MDGRSPCGTYGERLKYAILLNTQAEPDGLAAKWRHNLLVAETAEEAGFTAVHVPEHHMQEDGFLPQPFIACAAIASRTKTLQVGTAIIVAPLRDPIHLAEEAAVVDVISGGRLIVGLGIGNYAPEFDLFGVPMREQAARFDDILTVLTTAWSDGPLNMSGRVWDYEDILITPRPVQRPHPPLWVGAMSMAGWDRAARFGATLVLDSLHPVGAFLPYVSYYREQAEKYGTEASVALMRWAWLTDDPSETSDVWWPGVRGLFWHYLKDIPRLSSDMDARVTSMSGREEMTLEALRDDRLLVGTAREVRDQIVIWEEMLGLDWIVMRFEPPTGPSEPTVLKVVRDFGEEIIDGRGRGKPATASETPLA